MIENDLDKVLNYMKRYVENVYEHDSEIMLNWKDIKLVLEEIERLNKKIEQYENPEDMTLMFMWCDEKAKDEIKRLNNIIKEVREYIETLNEYGIGKNAKKELLEILDKVD